MRGRERERQGQAAAVGTFDGLHRGHNAVLASLREEAAKHGLKPVVFTFDRHPLELIDPSRAPKALLTPERKIELLKAAGVEPVVLPFDESLRGTTAADWMERLHRDYGVKLLTVGYDNTFGSDGAEMSVGDYRRLGAKHGIVVVSAPFVEGVSSSAIRRSVSAGEVEKAAQMLGYPYRLEGIVVEGNHIGRTIGFPTANIEPDRRLVSPAHGVYAATAILPDGERHPALLNIGLRPTVGQNEKPTYEAHIPDWNGDLYGLPLAVELIRRLRDERSFGSLEELRIQLEKDLDALHRLKRNKN